MEPLSEIQTSLISEKTSIEGKITFDQTTRVHGTLKGDIYAVPQSLLILAETAKVEGKLLADQLVIAGYVRGEIHARTRVEITSTGRVVGNIHTPSLTIDLGAYFEGKCKMDEAPATLVPLPSLA